MHGLDELNKFRRIDDMNEWYGLEGYTANGNCVVETVTFKCQCTTNNECAIQSAVFVYFIY